MLREWPSRLCTSKGKGLRVLEAASHLSPTLGLDRKEAPQMSSEMDRPGQVGIQLETRHRHM